MKWGTKYGPEYVNRLYAMVRRHLSGDFRFVCLTDDSTGIRSEVQCLPIPATGFARLAFPNVAGPSWPPSAQTLHGLRGTALFLDVDVVITGSLDEFFTQPGEFLIIHDYKRPWRITGNSSVYRFELGAHPDVLEYFRGPLRRNPPAVPQRAGLPVGLFCTSKASCNTGPPHGVPASSTTAFPRWPTNYWKAPFVPPGARIVIFHGECNPPDALAGPAQPAVSLHPPRHLGGRTLARVGAAAGTACSKKDYAAVDLKSES
jgi:hypothetical protein